MGLRKRLFLMLGYTYRLLYRLPVIGDPLVRGICGAIAFMNYRSPYGIKSFVSMDEFRKGFERLVEMADLDIEITGQDEEKLELVLTRCAYGFSRPEHRGVCDAAMDMDRKMFGYCGAKLVIDACIPDGSPVCKISIHGPQ
jgi:hypothetical protein